MAFYSATTQIVGEQKMIFSLLECNFKHHITSLYGWLLWLSNTSGGFFVEYNDEIFNLISCCFRYSPLCCPNYHAGWGEGGRGFRLLIFVLVCFNGFVGDEINGAVNWSGLITISPFFLHLIKASVKGEGGGGGGDGAEGCRVKYLKLNPQFSMAVWMAPADNEFQSCIFHFQLVTANYHHLIHLAI